MKNKVNIGNIVILTILFSVILWLSVDRKVNRDGILSCLQESSLTYIYEGTNDYWQTVSETKKLGTGDCEDFALLLYTKLKNKGFSPMIRIGYQSTKSEELHMWIELNYRGEDYILDPTYNLMKEKRDSREYISIPLYYFQDKLMDWNKRNYLGK